MSTCESNPPAAACPPTVEDLRRQAHERLDEIIAYCSNDQGPASFLEFETALPDRHGFWGRFVKSLQNTAFRRFSVAFHGLGNGRRLC